MKKRFPFQLVLPRLLPVREVSFKSLSIRYCKLLLIFQVLFFISERSNAQFPEYDIIVPGVFLPIPTPRQIMDIDGNRVAMLRENTCYIFEFNGMAWIQVAELHPSGSGYVDAVALSGDRVIIGRNYPGSAHVFSLEGNQWIETAVLTPSDYDSTNQEFTNRFGQSVAIENDLIVVGSPDDLDQSGSIYIYKFNGSSWEETKISSFYLAYSFLGWSVDISNGRIIASRFFSGIHRGSIFEYTGSSWEETKLFWPVDGNCGIQEVSISGDYALVSDLEYCQSKTGSVFIYHYDGSDWIETQQLTSPSESSEYDKFGYYVDIDGNYAVIGQKDASGGIDGRMQVYVYTLVEDKWVLLDSIGNKNLKFDVAISGNFVLAANREQVYAYLLPTFETPFYGAGEGNLGFSVAINNGKALAGAINASEHGLAYAYENVNWLWTEDHTLSAADAAKDDRFGNDVDLDDDRAIIGAFLNDDKGSSSGSAYIFDYSENGFVQTAKLMAEDGSGNDNFGFSVAVSGDDAIVSAPKDKFGKKNNAGSAYMFHFNGSHWVQTHKLYAPYPDKNVFFGYAVDLHGEWAAIGAYKDYVLGKKNAGAVYIFRRNGADWQFVQQLHAADAKKGDHFGVSVAMDGDKMVVGAYLADKPANNNGAAYVFHYDGNLWVQESKLIAADAGGADRFGSAVSISGNKIVVGSPDDNNAKGNNAGAVYVYQLQGGNWTETRKIIASDGDSHHNFGGSVAIDEQYIMVGAHHYNAHQDGTQISESGAVYIYDLSSQPDKQRYVSEVVANKEDRAVTVSTTVPEIKNTFSEVMIYPNPIQYQINILLDQPYETPINVTLLDGIDKVVFTQSVRAEQGKLHIDLQGIHLPKGIYFLQIAMPSNTKASYRLIKE